MMLRVLQKILIYIFWYLMGDGEKSFIIQTLTHHIILEGLVFEYHVICKHHMKLLGSV